MYRNTGKVAQFFRRLACRLGLGGLHPAIACWIYVDFPQPPLTPGEIRRAQQLAERYGWK